LHRYLVVSFDKTIQGDIASVADLYCRGADKDKIAAKQAETAVDLHRRLGKYRMPFMWAAVPAFTSDSTLNTSLEFSEFYRQDPDKLRNDEVCVRSTPFSLLFNAQSSSAVRVGAPIGVV
jgi:hypothetical protein